MIVTPSQEEEEIQSLLSLQCASACMCVRVCVSGCEKEILWMREYVCVYVCVCVVMSCVCVCVCEEFVCGVCVIERGIDN